MTESVHEEAEDRAFRRPRANHLQAAYIAPSPNTIRRKELSRKPIFNRKNRPHGTTTRRHPVTKRTP